MDAVEVIAQCRSLGAVLVSEGDTLRVTAPEPLPDYLRELLRVNKTQVGLVLQLCQRSVCANPLTPHSTHEHPWECDPTPVPDSGSSARCSGAREHPAGGCGPLNQVVCDSCAVNRIA